MRTVLAGLDASAAGAPVLDAARRLADLTDSRLMAVHVTEGQDVEPTTLALQGGVSVLSIQGSVIDSLVASIAAPDVLAGVFGARGRPGGRWPVGHTAMHVLERAVRPVVVVPPEAVMTDQPMRRLLVPLEGTAASSRPVLERLVPLIAQEVELVVLHVFTPATTPWALDRPERDLSIWGEEFVARFCPAAAHIELRTGSVGGQVHELCRDDRTDLVVLSWSQDLSAGHATVIREVLGASTVPVLLLPVTPTAAADLAG